MHKELGGKRLGSGNKMKVAMRNYERSTHNLSRQFRSSMAPGTLVPFLVEPALNGDTWDIKMDTLIRTHPTVAPVYGSFKVQLDLFQAPMRLYNRQLHNNKLGIGNHMERVLLPQVRMRGRTITSTTGDPNIQQINPSSLSAYLGIRGLGRGTTLTAGTTTRNFNGLGLIMYWDIIKNYYANKQEEIGMVISARQSVAEQPVASRWEVNNEENGNLLLAGTNFYVEGNIEYPADSIPIAGGSIVTIWGIGLGERTMQVLTARDGELTTLEDISRTSNYIYDDAGNWMSFKVDTRFTIYSNPAGQPTGQFFRWDGETQPEISEIEIVEFPLSNIDDLREAIFDQENTTPLIIGAGTGEINYMPYQATSGTVATGLYSKSRSSYTMSGLGLKTYQSDRFNNWLQTEWIDGEGGITEITSIDTSSGSFTMDTLNLAKKFYDLLNRIAVAGGSYDDWQEAVWGEDVMRHAESPMYCGGGSTEITFGEVVSSSDAISNGESQPLGTLAGKGREGGQMKGGDVTIKVKEPSYIMGLVSITPRIDYSQGNKWFTRLTTMNDWHKPALDGIGFQELITEEMAAWDTVIPVTGGPIYKSAGKQPSWIQYMTSQNETYGNFAIPTNEMFMTLNRQYQMGDDGAIQDLTTYIDPTKYDYIFAVKKLGAQNFWMQIGLDIHVRRKMSAKIMPHV